MHNMTYETYPLFVRTLVQYGLTIQEKKDADVSETKRFTCQMPGYKKRLHLSKKYCKREHVQKY